MKLLITLVSFSLLIPLFSYAATASNQVDTAIEALVTKDINDMLSETYDESDGTAKVEKAYCRILKVLPRGYTTDCRIEILVQPNRKRRFKNLAVCERMVFSVPKSLKTIEQVSGWEQCIEDVNNVTEF